MKLKRYIATAFMNNETAIGFSLLIYLLLSFTFSTFNRFFGVYQHLAKDSLTATLLDIVSYSFILLVVIALMSSSTSISFTKARPKNMLYLIPIFFSSFITSSILNLILVNLFKHLGISSQQSIRNIPSSFPGILLFILQYTVFPAVLEEILFRKVMLRRLIGYSNRSAIIISSVFFAVLHFDIPSFIVLFLLGVVFGYITIKSNSVFAAILLHFCHNLVSLVLGDLSHLLPEKFIAEVSQFIVVCGMSSTVYLFIRWYVEKQQQQVEGNNEVIHQEHKSTIRPYRMLANPMVIIFLILCLFLTIKIQFS